ncbi:hypothetical protein EDC96DRAFT_529554 [Choanephora cucurbitarum]|nr:hypothetical protein EDC96DRAFT_529554 [Choanephora cucurbitarum]
MDHIRRFFAHTSFPVLSLYFPRLRKTCCLDYGHFVHALFFFLDDYLAKAASNIPDNCSLSTLLELSIVSNHWIVSSRPTPLLMKHFFAIDESRNCFRPLHSSDQPQFPRLKQLFLGLIDLLLLSIISLYHTGVSLHPRLLVAFLETPVTATPVDDSSNRSFRVSLQDALLTTVASPLTSRNWHLFWSLSLTPECRSMWYRIVYDKFHCHASIAQFIADVSPSCSFCNVSSESRSHLLVTCPVKWNLWSLILRTRFPCMAFQPSHIISALWSLTVPPFVPSASFLSLCAATARAVWCAHWAFVRQAIPFTEALSKKVEKSRPYK